MGRPRNIANIYNPPKSNTQFSEGQKSKGILDDYAVRGDVATKEGTIEHTPTLAKHIVNKEYVDAQFPVTHASTTGQTTDDHHAETHTIVSHDTTATGAELDTLTDTSNADALHDHAHDTITSGTIADHDTGATGAELDTLTDNSMADTLHRHSELSASDGTPDRALVVDGVGKVGIGTASPLRALHVVASPSPNLGIMGVEGTTNAVDNNWGHLLIGRDTLTAGGEAKMAFCFGTANSFENPVASIGGLLRSSSERAGALTFYTRVNTAGTSIERMRIDENGNVGIGTDSPSNKLEIKSTGTSTNPLSIVGSANGDTLFQVREDGGGDGQIDIYDSTGNAKIHLTSDGDSYFDNGNVGIGTTAPDELLTVGTALGTGAAGSVITVGDATVSQLVLGEDANNWGVGYWLASDDTFRLGSSVGGSYLDTISIDAGNVVLEKTSGRGIKVDITTPTFGFADLLGDQFSKNTGATKPTLAAYNGAVDAWQFANGDEAFLTYHIPHDYVPGTDIHLHIHWSQTSATVTGGTLDFKYTFIHAKGHNQASGSAFTSTPITGTFSSININDGGAGLTRYQQHFTEVTISAATATAALLDRDDLEPDGVIELTFEMVTNNLTDSVTVLDPFIHYVDIHYQTTGLIGTKAKAPDFYT